MGVSTALVKNARLETRGPLCQFTKNNDVKPGASGGMERVSSVWDQETQYVDFYTLSTPNYLPLAFTA